MSVRPNASATQCFALLWKAIRQIYYGRTRSNYDVVRVWRICRPENLTLIWMPQSFSQHDLHEKQRSFNHGGTWREFSMVKQLFPSTQILSSVQNSDR